MPHWVEEETQIEEKVLVGEREQNRHGQHESQKEENETTNRNGRVFSQMIAS